VESAIDLEVKKRESDGAPYNARRLPRLPPIATVMDSDLHIVTSAQQDAV
jgi:hypothetical protein